MAARLRRKLQRPIWRVGCAGGLGTDIVWRDDIDMSADTLRRLVQEQSGPDERRRRNSRNCANAKRLRLTAPPRHTASAYARVAYHEQEQDRFRAWSRSPLGGWTRRDCRSAPRAWSAPCSAMSFAFRRRRQRRARLVSGRHEHATLDFLPDTMSSRRAPSAPRRRLC